MGFARQTPGGRVNNGWALVASHHKAMGVPVSPDHAWAGSYGQVTKGCRVVVVVVGGCKGVMGGCGGGLVCW